jgi:hypothetical protein
MRTLMFSGPAPPQLNFTTPSNSLFPQSRVEEQEITGLFSGYFTFAQPRASRRRKGPLFGEACNCELEEIVEDMLDKYVDDLDTDVANCVRRE